MRSLTLSRPRLVDGEVGGGVVAHDDHQGEDVFEREASGACRRNRRMPEPLTPSPGCEGDVVVPAGLARADLLHGFVEDGELDNGSGLHDGVGVESGGPAGVELAGIEGDVAMMCGGDLRELLLRGRVGLVWRGWSGPGLTGRRRRQRARAELNNVLGSHTTHGTFRIGLEASRLGPTPHPSRSYLQIRAVSGCRQRLESSAPAQ